MPRYYHIKTIGCQMNKYDSDYVGQHLQHLGLYPINNPEKADVVLINTCTVREKAQQKAFSTLGRMITLKRRQPALILGIMGCIAQQEGSNLIKRFPDLDIVLGTRERDRIHEALDKVTGNRAKIVATNITRKTSYAIHHKEFFSGRVTSPISIMEGCDNFCSYCVVPYVRGREISRSPQEIFEEAENLVKHGVKEITLLGQNVNSYFWAEDGGIRFSDLLQRLNALDGLLRIRFTTSHPKDLSDELIRCFQDLEYLCPHIHLPFQAGANRILKMMNRGYTRERYMELIKKLRAERSDIAITSDVMVGFPGESEEDFKKTLDLMQKIEFDNTFSFKYSDRKGTAAEKLECKIDEEQKAFRLMTLQKLQKKITLKKNKHLEGAVVEVLVEGKSKKGEQLTGRTGTNKIVNFNCENNIIGKLVEVKIDNAFANSLQGTFIRPVM